MLQIVDIREFQIQSNPLQGIIFLVGAGILVSAMIYLNRSKKVKSSAVFKSGAVNKPSLAIPENRNFLKAANQYRLEFDERKFLMNVFQKEAVDLSTVFESKDNIDAGFSKAINALNREEGTDADIAKLFAIRNQIEYYLSAAEAVKDPSKEKLTVRRYKRMEIHIPVVFYLVVEKEEQMGLKKIKKLSLDSVKHTGNILNISSGGCALSTQDTYKTGMRLKLEFKIGKTSIAALVQILRINRNRDGNVLHTRLLKASPKSLNTINALVYNYRDI
ncbi:MAG: PilZ domain-containing protein [Spirochaetaceae bacterium]|nr:PilZ domain-containing protein [Spirochaetaceae bacterium]